MHFHHGIVGTTLLLGASIGVATGDGTNTCTVEPAPSGGDSAPAIIDAFSKCGHDGKVVFKNETYMVNSVMNTTGLENCGVEIYGTLLWSTDIDYWLNNSLPVGYQNQSSAWLFGGRNLSIDGFDYGTLNGNGQVWYDFNNGTSNYPRRPHQITFTGIYDSVIKNIRFLQSQMWTMTVINADGVLLQDIYVNSTADDGASIVNTDGADTIYANNITFRRWTVDNGDDSISQKANSTNILMEDCDFYNGLGIAIGSIGQYNGRYETIQNVTGRNIRFYGTRNVARVKTWTGITKGYPPNGGGGGLGFASNLTFTNFTLTNVSLPVGINQCTSYNGQTGACDTSQFNIHDLSVAGLRGTTAGIGNGTVASMQCSGASPCPEISISDVELVDDVDGEVSEGYLCANVAAPQGFGCTGNVTDASQGLVT